MNIQISTTMGCTNNCLFCPQKKLFEAYSQKSLNKPVQMMSFDTFKTIIKKIPKDADILFCGMSEPFQNPDCTKMILYAHQHGHKIKIFTTLTGLNLNNLQKIIQTIPLEYHQDIFYAYDFYVHLPSEEKIEYIPINDTYLETLKFLIQSGKKIEFHYHGQKLNHQLTKLFENSNYIPFHDPIHNRAGNINFPSSITPKRKRGHIRCLCWGHVFLPNGLVTLCTNDYALKYPLGNILNSTYSQIENHQNVKFIQKAFLDDKIETLCRYCPNSDNANGVAQYYNTPFSIKKIPLALKIFLYNSLPSLYQLIYRSKHRFISKNSSMPNSKSASWLKK